jgi:hypothetical protein
MSLAGVVGTPSATFDGNLTLTVALGIGCDTSASQPNGAIKNVKIWATALTDAQIAAL